MGAWSFFPFFLSLPSRKRAGCDFWMLEGPSGRGLQERGNSFFWAVPQWGPGTLPAEPLALLEPVKQPRATGRWCL